MLSFPLYEVDHYCNRDWIYPACYIYLIWTALLYLHQPYSLPVMKWYAEIFCGCWHAPHSVARGIEGCCPFVFSVVGMTIMMPPACWAWVFLSWFSSVMHSWRRLHEKKTHTQTHTLISLGDLSGNAESNLIVIRLQGDDCLWLMYTFVYKYRGHNLVTSEFGSVSQGSDWC